MAKKTKSRKPPPPVPPANGEAKEGASSLTKMLSILDLFTPDKPIWSTNDLIAVLGTSRSTGYRYIKALNTSGLLSAAANGYYVLGPRIIELDLQIRSTDPLLQAGKDVLEQLVNATAHSALLCMLYRNSVICIREQLAPLSPEHLFSRGQRRSLFRGAMSKVILAHLPNHRLRSIFNRNQQEIRAVHLGANWTEFREALAEIRKDGHAISIGEFNPGILGIGAPIFNGDGVILGSIGIAMAQEERDDVNFNRVVVAVKRAAREITARTAGALVLKESRPAAPQLGRRAPKSRSEVGKSQGD